MDVSSYRDGGSVVLAWMMVVVLGDILSCTSTQQCVLSTLGAGEYISGVFRGNAITLGGIGDNKTVLCGVTPTLRRSTTTLSSGGKPGGGASAASWFVGSLYGP